MYSANVVRTTIMLLLVAATSLMAQGDAQPGPEHARLKQLEGSWDAVVRMGDSQTTATSVHRMGPGGLWLISEFKAILVGSPLRDTASTVTTRTESGTSASGSTR